MAVKFFGQFLLEKGAVSQEGLLRAIDLQESTNLKLGETALAMGILTAADIEKVHEAQKGEDLRFGDMALKLGLLTPEQMQQVLTRQKNTHLYIGEALVKVGALSEAELPGCLAEFKADQAPYLAEKVAIPQGVPCADVLEMMADLTYKMLTRVVGLAFRPGPCEVVRKLAPNDVVASMDFSGSANGKYLLSVTEEVRKMFARAILKEDDVEEESLEVLDDTVMEFANIVLGNVAAKAAQKGQQIEISPPLVEDQETGGVSVPADTVGVVFPVYIAEGDRFEFAVLLQA
ncbi:chemotaxis protein CheX [Desulfuromonas versatilis]|uniref:Chemotaxis protein CheX n=1 Tax=Desulfuromonas versatilis TaxID=2802975 RepID=A0ABN6DUU2_9BACT|nr:chemotaxis protein CheX [Desulfuromonas versatilis]BCR03279.1 chemotaxis protein CheX [Desulfuromonas versatilis]